MIYGPDAAWTPPVLTCSGLDDVGLDTVWQQVEQHRTQLLESGELDRKRQQQQVDWMWSMVREQLLARLTEHPGVRAVERKVEQAVRDGELTATLAADRILNAFGA